MNKTLHQSLSRALLLFAFILILPRAVDACGCQHTTTVLEDYEHAHLVIVARITSVTKGTKPDRNGSNVNGATMVVERVFKGHVKIGADLTFAQGDPILGCSWDFYEDQVGERFLLYLYQPEKPSDPFYVTTCNRSTGLENAHDDLLYLENIDKVRGRTRISGLVEQDGGDDEDDAVWAVRITGKNKTYIATTDKNGVYEVYDLPPGRYSLEPVLKFGWKVDEYHLTRQWTRAEWRRARLDLRPPKKAWFTLRPKQHFGVNIQLALNNRVAGRVTTPAGTALNRVCVSIVPTYRQVLACNDFTNADGTFNIESVDAGSYKLLINYENIKSSYQPFPTFYYPGVTSSDAAKVFTVKFGESIEDLNFIVPTLYETVKFEGVVRYSNGRPARDRWVGFSTAKTVDSDGSIDTRTDKHGRFSLTVLKGLHGDIYATYPPERREFATCPRLKKLQQASGTDSLVFETPRLKVDATQDKAFELRLPVSPCR